MNVPSNNLFNQVNALAPVEANSSNLTFFINNKERREIYLETYKNAKRKGYVIITPLHSVKFNLAAEKGDFFTFAVSGDSAIAPYPLPYEETTDKIKILKGTGDASVSLDISNNITADSLEGTCEVISPTFRGASCM